jgi:hypothetical protein
MIFIEKGEGQGFRVQVQGFRVQLYRIKNSRDYFTTFRRAVAKKPRKIIQLIVFQSITSLEA